MSLPTSSTTSTDDPVHRNFFDSYAEEKAPQQEDGEFANSAVATSNGSNNNVEKLVSYVNTSIIGRTRCIDTPFGWRRTTYADYTASGKPLQFLEAYMMREILPTYANTHTLTSFTGLQTTLFRKEARDIVARCMRASKDDVVLFTGAGSTAALKLLIHVMNLPARTRTFADAGHTGPSLIVLLGPYEHHSNLLPWREVGAEIFWAEEAQSGGVNLDALEKQAKELKQKYPHALRVGSFSAASNVSGLLTDSISVSRVLHEQGFLSVWDYASAAPYVEIDANPQNNPLYAKDAIIFSPHKFIGGPGASGCLLVKKSLLLNRVPYTPGGGTVFFVSEEKHRYLENAEEREEGGTPDILGSIRAGLAMQLKEQVGIRTIAEKEELYARKGVELLSKEPNIVLMGNPSAPRLPIFSFLVRFAPAPDTFLHSGFVSAVLNDLFGVQTRSGCLCAGPYAQRLLGMEHSQSLFEESLVEKFELLRPGFVRFNLGWWMSEMEVEFILQSVLWVARNAWRVLPLYSFIVDSGEWKHRSRLRKNLVGRHWLANISYASGKMEWTGTGTTKVVEQDELRSDKVVYAEYMQHATDLLTKLSLPNGYSSVPHVPDAFVLPERFKSLKWFVLPAEALAWIKDPQAAKEKHVRCDSLRPRDALTSSDATTAMDTSASTTAAPSTASASSFALLAPATSSQPEHTPVAFNVATSSKPKPATTSPQPQQQQGQKRPAPGPSKNQLKREAKKARKEASGGAGEKDENGEQESKLGVDEDEPMPDAASSSSTSLKRAPAGNMDDMKEDVCKNCWHVHWNAKNASNASSPTTAATPNTKECTCCPCINYVPSRAKSSKEIARIGSKIQKTVGKAIKDYSMIQNGDRVLIGISGGKDSLTLFHILRNLQRKAPVKFTLGCVTVDPQTPEYDPSPLKKYFASLGVPYFYESQPILAMAKEKMDPRKQSICSFCSRMKRGVLYTCLRREGYNVLALGQHLDDLAESLLMSIFHNGSLRTMKANYHAEAGDLRIIRPLIYVRERLTREYSNLADLPVINENCPACFEAPKERQRVKQLLAAQENVHPNLHSNMLQAMRPLLGLENYKYSGKSSSGDGGEDDDDDDGTTKINGSNAATKDLLRALQGINARTEEEQEDADMDAICRAPGGACAIPTRKGKDAESSAFLAASSSTDTNMAPMATESSPQ